MELLNFTLTAVNILNKLTAVRAKLCHRYFEYTLIFCRIEPISDLFMGLYILQRLKLRSNNLPQRREFDRKNYLEKSYSNVTLHLFRKLQFKEHEYFLPGE